MTIAIRLTDHKVECWDEIQISKAIANRYLNVISSMLFRTDWLAWTGLLGLKPNHNQRVLHIIQIADEE